MQLSVWLIRDCISNWLNNILFKAALSEDNYSAAGDLVTPINGTSCSALAKTENIKRCWWNQRTFVVDSVGKALCSTSKPSKCVHQNQEGVHLLVLRWELDCWQGLLYLCVVLLWICLLWVHLEEEKNANLIFFTKLYWWGGFQSRRGKKRNASKRIDTSCLE